MRDQLRPPLWPGRLALAGEEAATNEVEQDVLDDLTDLTHPGPAWQGGRQLGLRLPGGEDGGPVVGRLQGLRHLRQPPAQADGVEAGGEAGGGQDGGVLQLLVLSDCQYSCVFTSSGRRLVKIQDS